MPINMELEGQHLIWNGTRYQLKPSTLGAMLPAGTYQFLLNGELTDRDQAARHCVLSSAYRIHRGRADRLDTVQMAKRVRIVAADLATREAIRHRSAFFLLDGSAKHTGSAGFVIDTAFFNALHRALHTGKVDVILRVKRSAKRMTSLPMAAVA
ncbi:hypothetical protein [Chitinivorax sp. B]|uniref:hypothetical protein n=1 Tax=Chitinivorax sp. B TaxID=2502235 RepID=UPI0010F65886|nr:hypothetical protein [Chitinivorax sp. B]